MERKIGEVFEYEEEWYQCVKDTADDDCRNCDFDKNCKPQILGGCSSRSRVDGQSVAFKKLEKVGEPMWFSENSCFQRYALPIPVLVYKGDKNIFSSAPSEIFLYVEIEQKQRNMEEEKLNLKPFNLEAAKAGKPVCTRNGHKARVVCFNRYSVDNNAPIVACVKSYDSDNKEFEDVIIYREDGSLFESHLQHPFDLMMLPEKHDGWVNVYRDFNIVHAKNIFDTREEALKNIGGGENCVATVKIEWEE